MYLNTSFAHLKKTIIPLFARKHSRRTLVLGILGLLMFFYAYQMLSIYYTMQQVRASADEIIFLLKEKEWARADSSLAYMQRDVRKVKRHVARLYPFTKIPLIKNETNIALAIADAGNETIDASRDVVQWLSAIPLLQSDTHISLDSFSVEQKKELLQAIADAGELWESVHQKTQHASLILASIQGKSNIPAISGKINSATQEFINAQSIFTDIQPFLTILPTIAGYPSQKTYLLLLQNNTELRPTGGFIGTYGILRIHNAEVASLTTENVYNLDEPYKSKNTKVPPLPLQKYIKQSQWFLRDSNWDPDFPTSAKQAIQFYYDEGGTPRGINGVIALTPTVVERLLTLVGPIQIEGNSFTAENLIDILAFHVEKGFIADGITEQNRKLIIDKIAQELKNKLLTLSLQDIDAAFNILLTSLDDRQLQMYFTDASIQKVVESYNWGGAIRDTNGDYVFVVDANLGSLKSDPAVTRSITYTVTPQPDGALRAKISITYTHTKNFDWKTTRYRTYTRIYTPLGSTLLSAKGNEEQISITNEHNKTVFGTFISIEPLKSETLTFEYTLPASIVRDGTYTLLMQKQAGTMPHAANISITLPFTIARSVGSVPLATTNSLLISTFYLNKDTEFSATKKQ